MKKIIAVLQKGTLITLPFILLMGVVLIIFEPWYLSFEYQNKNFPADPYGFTISERLNYGIISLNYVFKGLPDNTLADLKKADGSALYNERELSHMKDVKNVFQNAKKVWKILLLFDAVLFVLALLRPELRSGFLDALKKGSVLTGICLFVILIFTFTSFDSLFEHFHELFFKEGTWLFYESDSLIRLYPEKLWVDGFIWAAVLTLLFSLIVFMAANFGLKKQKNNYSEKC